MSRDKLIREAAGTAASVMSAITDEEVDLIDRLNRVFDRTRIDDYATSAALIDCRERLGELGDEILVVVGCDDLVGNALARSFVLTRLLTLRRGGRPRLTPRDRLVCGLHGIPLPDEED